MTKPSVANNKLVEAQHLDACSPQWLPVLLVSSFQPPLAPHNGRLTSVIAGLLMLIMPNTAEAQLQQGGAPPLPAPPP